MKYTEKYQLPQWEKADRILMEDFNAQSAKLEAALTAQGEALAGKADAAQVSGTLAAHAAALAGKAEAAQVNSALAAHTAALNLKCEAVVGTYQGTGGSQHIALGFQPAAVLLFPGRDGNINYAAALILPGYSMTEGNANANYAWITADGFTVSSYANNENYGTFRYIAFRKI